LLLRERLRLETLADQGTANVLLFAEKYAACSYWALTEGEQTPWYTADRLSGFQVRPEVCDPARPQTPHHSGIQVGMADGSVRTVSPRTSPAEWFRLHGSDPPTAAEFSLQRPSGASLLSGTRVDGNGPGEP
jgi:hypothetical protein